MNAEMKGTYEQISDAIDKLDIPNNNAERLIYRAAWDRIFSAAEWTEDEYMDKLEESLKAKGY